MMAGSSPTAILRRHGLRPKKSWGQCFLHDPRVVAAIVDAAAPGPDETVVEIGAGLGVLTAALARRSAHVVAIERDRDLARVLRLELDGLANVEIVEANALHLDLGRWSAPVSVVGNLPYNISSPILFHLLGQRQRLRVATLMLQRELAQRIVAAPGNRTYGAPSVICQHLAEVRLCLQVGRGAFTPAPRVDSAVIRLQPRGTDSPPLLQQVVQASFGQRRKTLQRALAARFDGARVAAALRAAGIDGGLRAERLSVAQFVALAEAMAALADGEL